MPPCSNQLPRRHRPCQSERRLADVSVQRRKRAANDWPLQHFGSLSLSGAGLVIVAQTAVEAAGRISHGRQGPRSEPEELLEVLADHRGIKPEEVFVGNGSDEGESR